MTEVRSFLGLVRYIAMYLPKLVDYTQILMPLTMEEVGGKLGVPDLDKP
jgi:hypothetical protein